MKKHLQTVIWTVVYIILAVVLMAVIVANPAYPLGEGVLNHIYKGGNAYDALKSGVIWPLYDRFWYNGVSPFRYWAPIPAFIYAVLQFISGGNPLGAYIIWNGLIFFAGAFSFMMIGKRRDRQLLGGFLGLLWFFSPACMKVAYEDGNLQRMFCFVLLPWLIHLTEKYLTREKEDLGRHELVAVSLIFAVMIMSDPVFSLITGLTFAVYFFIYSALNHCFARAGLMLVSYIASVMISGLWLVSYGKGRNSASDIENLPYYFQDAWKSLNPVGRIISEDHGYYFGIAFFILILFGLIASNKRSGAGFGTAGIIFLASTTMAYPLIRLFPGAGNLGMLNYLPLAACLILFSLLTWKTLKKPVVIGVLIVLALDCLPSMLLLTGSGEEANERLEQMAEDTLIKKAQEITRQRLALLDLQDLGADGAFVVSAYDVPLMGTYGSDYRSARTAYNITQLDKSYSGGQFSYLFDRCLELGNDSVIIWMEPVSWDEDAAGEMDMAAALSGYNLVDLNENYRLYHTDVDGQFGVLSDFSAIGIGSGAGMVSLDFPTVEERESTNINDYTYEELSKYKTIYLNGFTYEDKKAAEELLITLAENGVRVVILADGIPEDEASKAREFLGVTAHDVIFSNGYPELETASWGIINTDLFPQGYTTWRTVYVTGLDKTYARTREDGVSLDFYGSVKNDNIMVLAINLTYHYALTRDRSVTPILTELFKMEIGQMPLRQTVPIKVAYGSDRIEIDSDYDDVDTTIAMHDMFTGEGFRSVNRLVHVDKGHTVIYMEEPYVLSGVLWCVAGVISLIGLVAAVTIAERNRKRRKELEELRRTGGVA